MSQAERILFVDDDKEIVRLMRTYLAKSGYDVRVAYDGKTALHMLRQETPDLVLLDLMLPDLDGWDITRKIRADVKLAHLPIIMMTARVADEDKIIGLELGADDYVTKPYNPREVVARVRARLRISSVAPPLAAQILEAGELRLHLGKREVQLGGKLIKLTRTEFDILHALMQHVGFVMTRQDLINQALGRDFEGIDRTLDSHVRNLRRKLGEDPKSPRYVQTIYGIGYRLNEG